MIYAPHSPYLSFKQSYILRVCGGVKDRPWDGETDLTSGAAPGF